MIVKQNNLGFFGLLVEMRGSIVPAIMPHIVSSALLGVIACILTETGYLHSSASDALTIGFGPFTALGVAISLFLGFHNNASYNRWWEARILWGKQIIVTRDITRFLLATTMDDHDSSSIEGDNSNSGEEIRIECSNSSVEEWNGQIQLQNFAGKDIESNYTSLVEEAAITDTPRKEVIRGWRQNIVRLSCAHTHSCRHQLRPHCKMDGTINTALRDRNRFLTQSEQRKLLNCRNPANSILFMASKILGSAHKSKLIETYSMIHVQTTIDKLCEIQTACERIHNTSLPLAYSLLVHRTSVLYVLLVPFAIVENVGWWTPLFTAIMAYTFFGLDQLAKNLQDPFNDNPMCLALSAMSRTIEIDVLEALGLNVPMPLKPKGNQLM